MKINFNPQIVQNSKFALNNNRAVSSPISYQKDECSFTSSVSETRRKNYQLDKEEFALRQRVNPNTAFLYNPDITVAKRKEMAAQNPSISDIRQFSRALGLKSDEPVLKWIKEGKLIYDLMPRTVLSSAYIDSTLAENIEFADKIQEKLPDLRSFQDLSFEFNIPEGKLIRLLQTGGLNPLEAKYVEGEQTGAYIFDLADETNAQTLAEHVKLNPVPSKKYYKKLITTGSRESILVPVTYLSRLGYGKASQLAQMIKDGVLPGVCEKIDTPSGIKTRALVDIAPYISSEEKLTALRNRNKSVVSTSDLAKKLSLRKTDLDEAVKNGELSIIGEFIFPEDSKKVLVNLAEEKNREFFDKKVFENQVLEEVKAQRRQEAKAASAKRARENAPFNSLRMRLVWQLCPLTRQIASVEAKNNGYVAFILAKDDSGEELTDKEQAVLNSYRKRFWNISGTQEYMQAQKKASEYMRILKEQGLEAIDDPQIRKTIEEFNL